MSPEKQNRWTHAHFALGDRRREKIRELENKVALLESARPANPTNSTSTGLREELGSDELLEQVTPSISADQPSTGSPWHDISAWLEPSGTDFSFPDLDVEEPLIRPSDIAGLDPLLFTNVMPETSYTNQMAFESATDASSERVARDRLLGAGAQSTPTHTHSTASKDILIYRPSSKVVSAKPDSVRDYYLSLSPTSRNNLRVLAQGGDYKFVDILLSVSETTEPFETASSAMQDLFESRAYSPYRNVLRIARLSYFAAFFANFSSLGFDFSVFLDETSLSPFCGQNSSDVDNSDIPIHLRPVASQFTVSHHPYIDSLPFPTFRRRALAALAADPPLLDEDDLCIDLMLNDGLVCWGSVDNGVDHGTPWDCHSWEAKEWFLQKWWWLVGGQDSELFQSSRWWASQRGERISMKLPLGGNSPAR